VTLTLDAHDIVVGTAAALGVLGVWAALERGRLLQVRERWTAILATVLAAAILAVVVEDVVNQEQGGLVLSLDAHARTSAHTLDRRGPAVAAAALVSRLTGEGLVGLVVGTAAALVATRRRRDAAILMAGTLGAWLLSYALKMGFGVLRPRAPHVVHKISGYGFPSAHVLVTLVASGLIVWLLGRDASRRARLALYAAAAGVTALTGAARVVLDFHWLSDVVAAVAVGILWLNLVVLATSRLTASGRVALAPGESR
jgi:membrane-associated phospholipid phosphatase